MAKSPPKQVLIAAKIPPVLAARLAALYRPLSRRPDLLGFDRATKSLVLKHVIARGLDVLERELGVKTGGA